MFIPRIILEEESKEAQVSHEIEDSVKSVGDEEA